MDELLRGIPCDVAAEQGVLGSMLVDPRCVPAVMGCIRPGDFYLRQNRELFESMRDLFTNSKPVDLITILAQMRENGKYDGPSSRAYVQELMDVTPTAANIAAYVDILKDASSLRSAQAAAQKVVDLTAEGAPPSGVRAALVEIQTAMLDGQVTQEISLSEATLNLYDELEERARLGKMAGIPTGIDELDNVTGGLRPGNMIVLAARPGMGKSALALNIAANAVHLTGKPILFFSLEMSASELTERLYSAQADIDFSRLRNARLLDEDWSRLAGSTGETSQWPFFIVDAPTLGISDISLICKRVNPALVVIDHIGLIESTGRHGRREAMDETSRSIKRLAKDLRVPVLALAQLNRAIMSRSNKAPMLSDLRESGAIEADADIVLFIDRPAYYDQAQGKNVASIIVAKNRHGESGTVPLLWFGSRQKFTGDWTETAAGDP